MTGIVERLDRWLFAPEPAGRGRAMRAAIAGLQNSDHRGRPLTVNESRPRRTVRDLYAGGWFGGGAG